jgi:uncharacterized protein
LNRHLFLIVLLFLCSTEIFSQKSQSVPQENKIRTYVTDKTGTLTSSQTTSLETKLSNFDKQTSTQVVVYIISTLNGDVLEEKSIEIAEQNGIGKKSKNNGVLLFIVKDDRKLRIEVGYGLEGALPDATCDQIIRKEITPFFKQGQYYEGIDAGVDSILKATKGEYTQDTKDNKYNNGDGSLLCGIPIFIGIVFIFIFIFIIFSIIRRVTGGGHGYIGSSGGWFSGGSSWGGGSSFGGGGFSGGGGSFGGGGASGSW